MSGSPIRPAGPRRQRRRAGPDKPIRHGFTRIPEEARPAVLACMDAMGLGAVYDLCAGLRFELAEIVRMEEVGQGRWSLNSEIVPLPAETCERLRALKELLADRASPGRRHAEWLSDGLKKVTTNVRQTLEVDFGWAQNLVVNAGTLHQMADEEAYERYGEDTARLRTYRRDPRARADVVRPPTTVMAAHAFDTAISPLLEDVWSRCTPRGREAIERLKERGK